MAFVYGAVSWTDHPSAVGSTVDAMRAAVSGYPWTSSRRHEVASASSSCVLAVDHQGDEPFGGDRRSRLTASCPSDEVELVADIQLHDRHAVAAMGGVASGDSDRVSDEELIKAAYLRRGPACASEILGEGAFALWDGARQRLVCWRDPVGVRPLYYHHVPGRHLVFSSDLRALVAHPQVPHVLDLAYVRGLLDSGGRLMHPRRTMVEGVRKLPAGHVLIADVDGLGLERYWYADRVSARDHRHDADYVEELRGLVVEAIRCRMPGDGGSVGAHLSGGLDSSSIAVVAARQRGSSAGLLPTFSWAPSWEDVPPIAADERHLVEATARAAPIEHHYAQLRPSDLLDVICRDVATMPLHTLHFESATSRTAAELGLRTILSGWGGDESVAYNGRGYFASLARRGRFRTIHRELRDRAAIHGGTLRGAWKSRVVMPQMSDAALRRIGWLGPASTPTWPGELRPEFVQRLREAEPLTAPLLRERPGVRQTQLMLLDLGHLQYRMESWASHGATLGLRYAFPLLDRRLLEFALSIPDHLYFQRGWKRWIYRMAMDGILPDEVRWNPTKSDDAMVQQYWTAKQGISQGYRERLEPRKDNPLVDVDILLAAAEGRRRPPGDDPSVPLPPVGDAAWMAFTELRSA